MNAKSFESDRTSIKSAALALLARREHSRLELLEKLSRKFSDDREIERQIEELANKNLQSEERFVESFVRARQNGGKGPRLIKQELKRRGVSQFLIESYVAENDECWLSIARDVYTGKFAERSKLDAREKAKRIRFMVSRGFSPDVVFHLMQSHAESHI